jgi:predicted nucleic acid-binding protein
MPPRPQRDYWDANVFLALFQRSDEPKLKDQRENSIRLLEDARKGAGVIVTSAFTIAEARRGDGFPPLPGSEHATLKAFFKHQFIEIVPVDRAIAELAAEYGGLFNLNPGDAVQLATAVRSKASRFLTWDGDFHRKVAMKNPPLPIDYPLQPPDPKPPMLEAIEAAEAAEAAASAATQSDEDYDETDEDVAESRAEETDELFDDESGEDDLDEPESTVADVLKSAPEDGGTASAEATERDAKETVTVEQASQIGSAIRGGGQAPTEHASSGQGAAPGTAPPGEA